MRENDSSDWRKLFQEVLTEIDLHKMPERIEAVEGSIFVRLQELECQSDAEFERSDIQAAIQVLASLKAEKPSYPPISGVWARTGR